MDLKEENGGGIYIDYNNKVDIEGCLIVENTARNAPAIYFQANEDDSERRIKGNLITGNIATGHQGSTCAVYISGYPSVNNNDIYGNTADYEVYIGNNYTPGRVVNLKNNYWGTADEFEVISKIYCWFNDSNRGMVEYQPFLTTPVWEEKQDTTPPAKIQDLTVIGKTKTSITLQWTAPGDDGNTGRASAYEIRYSTTSPFNWDDATSLSNPPTPRQAGATEQFTVGGLSPGTTYYFALKAADEAHNWSEISNIAEGKTETPQAATSMKKISGDGQTGVVGTILQPLVIMVTDQNGNPIAGVSVKFEVIEGSGTLSTDETVTGDDGKANVELTLGSVPGTVKVKAYLRNKPDVFVEFILTATQQTEGYPPIAPRLDLDTVRPGQEFWLEIIVGSKNYPVSNLFGVSFVLNYGTDYLDAKEASQGDLLENDVLFLPPTVDDVNGKVPIGITRKRPNPGINGFGVVARVKFKIDENAPRDTILNFSLSEVVAKDPNGNEIPLTPQTLQIKVGITIMVWPGDTDNDGKVDQTDVLPIGLHWNREGPARTNASMSWQGQAVEPWDPEDATYADADGSGKVDQADVLPIGLNWNLTHDSGGSPAPTGFSEDRTEATLILLPPYAKAGEEFYAEIAVIQPDEILGLSFVLKYDLDLVDVLSVEKGELLGSDVLSLYRVESGKISIGITRKVTAGGVSEAGVAVRVRMRCRMEKRTEARFEMNEIMISYANGKMRKQNGIQKMLKLVPTKTALFPNYPNPFNPETWIPFALAENSEVIVRIYNLQGKLVREMNLGELSAGYYLSKNKAIRWDGRNKVGERAASGIYLVEMKAGKKRSVRRIVMIK
ncbi:Ig-like domain-containing protein [Candidatus Poribacteria bacterium]|nr:Ig-like domain-containing protein [Candidatus Poribacteria bacterium]